MAANDISIPPPSQAPPTPRSHPFGLRAIIFLLVLQAIVYLVVAGLLIVATRLQQADPSSEIELVVESPFTLALYFLLILPYLFAAAGLWRRRRWAWVLTMVLVAISMTEDLVAYFAGQPTYFSMALNVITVGYLNQRELQLLFGELPKPDDL